MMLVEFVRVEMFSSILFAFSFAFSLSLSLSLPKKLCKEPKCAV